MEQIDFYELLNDLSLDEVFQAYFDCRRRKRHSLSSLKFESDYERYLMNLYRDIVHRRYRPTTSQAFIVKKPVIREVFAAHFRDRIVHHLVMGRLIPIFERIFSDYSYSCRLKKGTLYGIRSVSDMMRECSEAYQTDCYVLRLDIHGFFFHIDKDILYRKVKQVVDSCYFNRNKSTIIYLVQQILWDNPVIHCHIRGDREDWRDLPKNKSLFFSGKHRGLPIGNLTSQIFANFYLNDFDHFICGLDPDLYYGRYVDDLVLIHPSADYLLQVRDQIQSYLRTELRLSLHPRKVSLQHYSKGFAFIGAYIKCGRIYPGKRLRVSFYRKMHSLNKEWAHTRYPEKDAVLVKKTLSSINSYFGLLKHFNAWRVKLKGWNLLSEEIRACFRTDESLKKVWIEPELKRTLLQQSRDKLFAPLHRRPRRRYHR